MLEAAGTVPAAELAWAAALADVLGQRESCWGIQCKNLRPALAAQGLVLDVTGALLGPEASGADDRVLKLSLPPLSTAELDGTLRSL